MPQYPPLQCFYVPTRKPQDSGFKLRRPITALAAVPQWRERAEKSLVRFEKVDGWLLILNAGRAKVSFADAELRHGLHRRGFELRITPLSSPRMIHREELGVALSDFCVAPCRLVWYGTCALSQSKLIWMLSRKTFIQIVHTPHTCLFPPSPYLRSSFSTSHA